MIMFAAIHLNKLTGLNYLSERMVITLQIIKIKLLRQQKFRISRVLSMGHWALILKNASDL